MLTQEDIGNIRLEQSQPEQPRLENETIFIAQLRKFVSFRGVYFP